MTAVTVTLKTTVADASLIISALRESAVTAYDRAKGGPPREREEQRKRSQRLNDLADTLERG